MSDTNDRLEMRWLPVVGADGRTHMEATWISVPTTERPSSHAA